MYEYMNKTINIDPNIFAQTLSLLKLTHALGQKAIALHNAGNDAYYTLCALLLMFVNFSRYLMRTCDEKNENPEILLFFG